MKYLAVSLALISASTSLHAQVIDCGRVLNEKLINVRSLSISEGIIARMKTDICNQEFESAESARSYMRSGGWNLNVFDYFDNSLEDNKSRSNSNYSVKSSEFCDKSASDLARSLGTNFRENNGQFVLEAYQQCVKSTNIDTLYMSYDLIGSAETQLVSGRIHRAVPDSAASSLAYRVEGLSITPPNAGVTCQVLSQQIPGDLSTENPIRVDSTPAAFSCAKSQDKSIIIDIQTSEGSFTIVAPSAVEEELRKVDELEQQIVSLNDELESLRGALSENQAQLGELSSEFTAHRVLAVATVDEGRLDRRRSTPNVSYNATSGVLTFPNPDGANYVVLVADNSEDNKADYLTETNYVRTNQSSTEVKLWRTTLSTDARNGPANNFNAIVLRAGR